MTLQEAVAEPKEDHIGDADSTVEVPPLQSGDRLTRREFERRYHAMPQVKKAELIEGVVYMPTPVRFEEHGEPHGYVVGWLAVYCAATPGVRLGDNSTVMCRHCSKRTSPRCWPSCGKPSTEKITPPSLHA